MHTEEEKTGHTPGPWEHHAATVHHGPYITREETGITIADLYFRTPDGPSPFYVHYQTEAEANARLIAAAPDLLEVLERQARAWENALELGFIPEKHTGSANIILSEAHKAIAKAKGLSPSPSMGVK